MEGLDDVFGEPNGPAYESRQTRTGPPLEYVSEKLGNALKHLHRTVRSIERFVPDSLMPSEGDRTADIAVKERLLLSPARAAFYYALVAFLALSNLLALADEDGLVDRLLGYDAEEFGDWMDQMQRGGSVTG